MTVSEDSYLLIPMKPEDTRIHEEVCYLGRKVERPDGSDRRRLSMPFSFAQFITWLIVGLLGGSAAGYGRQAATQGIWHRGQPGPRQRLGRIIGGAVFHVFSLFARLDAISISLRDLLAAFLGSLFVLGECSGLGGVTAGAGGLHPL